MTDWLAAAVAFEDADAWDPRDIVVRLHAAGFTRVVTAADVDVAELCAAREALAYRSPAADAILAVLGLGCHPVKTGPHVDAVAAGRAACGFALTEPDAGSDVQAMACTATPQDGGAAYALAGKKTFISNAPIADWFVVFARAPGGPAAFVVERADGVRVIDDVPMSAPHPIASLDLDGVVVPAARRVGAEGEGVKLALATLDVFRASVGAAACGMAARALDESISRVKTRRQFGKALADFQLTQARLANMKVDLEAARALVARAAARRGKLDVAIAKLYATEAAQRVIDSAVQLHGGLGVVRGVRVEALYREVRALRIYEGTSEIQQLIIARELLK